MEMIEVFITVSCYSFLVAFILACLLNSLQVYLILTKTEKHMKRYSNILLQSVILDFISATAYFLFQMHVFTDNPFIFVRSNPLFFPVRGKLKCISPLIYALFYNISFWSIPLQCLSRYYTLCRGNHFPRFFMVPLYAIIFVALTLSGWYYVIGYVPITENSDAQIVINKLPYWKDDPNKNQFCVIHLISSNVFVHLSFLNGFAFFGLCVIIYTLQQVKKFLKIHQRLMNQKASDMHNQLGKRLHLQSLVPFICWINTFLLVTFGMTLNVHYMLILMFIPYPWITVINSIVTIKSIRNYRRTVRKWLKCFCILTKLSRIIISSVDIDVKRYQVNPAAMKD